MRAWDVAVGHAAARRSSIENSYVDVTNARRAARATRRFAPTAASRSAIRATDGGEEINARIRVTRRAARQTCATPSSSTTTRSTAQLSGEFHLYGEYQPPFGFGQHDDRRRRRVRRAVRAARPRRCASRATACASTASRSRKGTGAITGAAFVGWDGTYSFNADGRAHPGRAIADRVAIRGRRCRALLEFTATGQRRRSTSRATTCGSRSTTCSSATKASARSPGTLALRGQLLTRRARGGVAAPRRVGHRAASR